MSNLKIQKILFISYYIKKLVANKLLDILKCKLNTLVTNKLLNISKQYS